MSAFEHDISIDEKIHVRELILQNTNILKQVCDATDSYKVGALLATGEDFELELIGYLCHLSVTGVIPMTRANYRALCQRKKRGRLQQEFGPSRRFEAFKLLSRAAKYNIIIHVGVGVSYCLKSIFYLPDSAGSN